MPGIKATLLDGCIRCLETGEPLILNDFSYDNEVLLDTRRYDLRTTRATRTSIVLTWRDVTERFQAAKRPAESDERYQCGHLTWPHFGRRSSRILAPPGW